MIFLTSEEDIRDIVVVILESIECVPVDVVLVSRLAISQFDTIATDDRNVEFDPDRIANSLRYGLGSEWIVDIDGVIVVVIILQFFDRQMRSRRGDIAGNRIELSLYRFKRSQHIVYLCHGDIHGPMEAQNVRHGYLSVLSQKRTSMQVTGSRLLNDPIIQSSIISQNLPWMTSRTAKKRSSKSDDRSGSRTNIPKKILNVYDKKNSKPTKVRRGEPHPILIECSRSIADEYWSDILEDMSYGQFPKGFSIKSNSLSYKKSATRLNNISMVQTDDYEELANQLVGFISSNANMYSPEDIKNSKIIEMHQDQVERHNMDNLDWKSIKSRNVQSIHLYNFACTISERHNMDIAHVYSILAYHVFLTDHVEPENIRFEEGLIVDIQGLTIDEENRTIHFPHDVERRRRLFIEDPVDREVEVDQLMNRMDSRSISYTIKPKPKFTFDKSWHQILRDIMKDQVRIKNNTSRSLVMSTLSTINRDELELLESSIISN